MKQCLFVLLSVVLVSPFARAELWRGDFETGDVSQWTKLQSVSKDRIQIVQDPVQEGRYAARVVVRSGDNPIGASGNRNELVYTADEPADGEVRWYRWHVLWPEDYESADTWQIFTQWHHWIGGGSPPLAFYVRNEELHLGIPYGVLWRAPLKRGEWHEFVFGVRWSADASVGWVELELNGEPVLERTPHQTLLPGTGSVYLKQGLYRSDKIRFDQTVFVDGMTIGTTREGVLPEPVLPVEEPPAETPVIELPVVTPPAEEESATWESPAGDTTGEAMFRKQAGCASAVLPGSLALLGLLLRRRKRQG